MDGSFSAMNTSGETFEVEKIIAIRTDKDGRTLYKVRWLGFDEADDTWEPYENLAEDCDRLIETFYLNSEGEEGNLIENEIDSEFAEEASEGSQEILGEGFLEDLIESESGGAIVMGEEQLQQEDGISYEEDGTSVKIPSEEIEKIEEFEEAHLQDGVSELQQHSLNNASAAGDIMEQRELECCGQSSSAIVQQQEQSNELVDDDSMVEQEDADNAYETVEVLTPESWNRFGDLENREIANLFVENRIPSQTEKVLCEIGFDVGRVTRNKLRTVLKTGSASPSPAKKPIAATTKPSPLTTGAAKNIAKTPRRVSNKKARSRKKATSKEIEKLTVDDSSLAEEISNDNDGILRTTDESVVRPSVSKDGDSLVGTSQNMNGMASERTEKGLLDREHSEIDGSVGVEEVENSKKSVKKGGKRPRKNVKNENSAVSSPRGSGGKSRGKRRQQRGTGSSTSPSKRRKISKGNSSEASMSPESLDASAVVIKSENKSKNDNNNNNVHVNGDNSNVNSGSCDNSDNMDVTTMAIVKTEDSDGGFENFQSIVNDNDTANDESSSKNVADSGKHYDNFDNNAGLKQEQEEQGRASNEQLKMNGEPNGLETEIRAQVEVKKEMQLERESEKGSKKSSQGRRGGQKSVKVQRPPSAVNRKKRNPKVSRRKKLQKEEAKEEANGCVCDGIRNDSGNDNNDNNNNSSAESGIGHDLSIRSESHIQSNNNNANDSLIDQSGSLPSSSSMASEMKEQGHLSSASASLSPKDDSNENNRGEKGSLESRSSSATSANLQASGSARSARGQSTGKSVWVSLSSCLPSTSAATKSIQPLIQSPQISQPATQISNQIPKQISTQSIAPQNRNLSYQPVPSSSASSSSTSASSEYADYRARALASLPLPVSIEPIQQIEAMEFRKQFKNREEPLKNFMALRSAVLAGRVNAVRWTARCPQEKRGFDFNQCFHGKTLAYEICERKCNMWSSSHLNDDMLRVLVMGGARLDIPEERNLKTPLHAAIENASWCLVRTLLYLRSPVNTFDAKKKTPLHYAIECKDANAVRAIYLLLEFGADVNEVLKTVRVPRFTSKLEQHQHKLAEALDEARMKTFISMTVKRRVTPVMVRSMWESEWNNFTVELSFHFETCLLPNKRYVYLVMLAVFDYCTARYWRVRMWGRSPFESVRMNNNSTYPLQDGPNGFVFATRLVNGWNRLQIRYHPFVKNKKLLLMAQVVLAQRDKPHVYIQQPALEVAAESGTDWIKE